MISKKTLKSIEYDKIMSFVKDRAVLKNTKNQLECFVPLTDFNEVDFLLKKTTEAYKLLYTYSLSGICYFDDLEEELKRVEMGGTLLNGELLKVASNLRSARLLKDEFDKVKDETVTILPNIVKGIYVNQSIEDEITTKILSEDEISDNASVKLSNIRKNIRNLNAKIREQLNSYMHSNMGKYLQEGVVTMRKDRYVIPVKSEYRSFIKGFVHDQSASGATVFIEPEYVMELNNDLKAETLNESLEMHRILAELTSKIAFFTDGLRYNAQILEEVDNAFSRAIFSFDFNCSLPIINDKGVMKVQNARHPLIDKDKVVPVSFDFGKEYNFLLITGPNTGGKTVTLKLAGLLSLMAMSGLYVPCSDDSEISVFKGIYCDIGDEQSIEQSLSTFSSHITNIINIINNVDNNSLVLLDEIGAGTDPEEGSALSLAIIDELLGKNCCGIITTHYSKLKEYAANSDKIENACMEFDSETLKPLYKLNIGIPGSSNALKISQTLGLNEKIIKKASGYINENEISFEKVLKQAEESRLKYNYLLQEVENIKREKQLELEKIQLEKEEISKQKDKIFLTSKQEIKRIVADKLEEAEQIIEELKKILKDVGLESKLLFRAGELKNRLKNSRYLINEDFNKPYELKSVKPEELKQGNKVYVKSLGTYGKILNVKKKNEVEILIGNIKTVVKISDVFNSEEIAEENKVEIKRNVSSSVNAKSEINVIGKDSLEVIDEVNAFLDQSVLYNLEEVKIIHGVGEGILLKTIRNYLKTDKRVKEFRRGKYGEGENGVTIVTLK